LCQNIITDAETNVVSYIITIDSIATQELPAKIPFLAIGTSWEKDTGPDIVEHFAIRIVHLSPRELPKTLLETNSIAVKSYRHRMNFLLNGFTFEDAGLHHLNIEAKIDGIWTDTASIPVLVVLTRPNNKGKIFGSTMQ
jgi:hypothetical protein